MILLIMLQKQERVFFEVKCAMVVNKDTFGNSAVDKCFHFLKIVNGGNPQPHRRHDLFGRWARFKCVRDKDKWGVSV